MFFFFLFFFLAGVADLTGTYLFARNFKSTAESWVPTVLYVEMTRVSPWSFSPYLQKVFILSELGEEVRFPFLDTKCIISSLATPERNYGNGSK